MFGRRILPTTLDPVPDRFRACPGIIVLNARERRALSTGDGEVFKKIADICHAEDAAEARGVYKYPRMKQRKKRIAASERLLAAAALYRGRR